MSSFANTSELHELPLKKLFWKYTIPTIMAMLVNGMYTVTDGLFIGRYIGADGLAAINLIWTVYGFAIGVGIMIGSAASALFTIEKGKENYDSARRYLANGIFLLLLGSLITSLILKFSARSILEFQLPDAPHILKLADDYFNIIIIASVCPLFSAALPMLIRNDEKPALATKLMIFGAVFNIIGDYVFIYHFHWEMEGAAIATVGAQAIITLVGLGYFFSPASKIRLHLSDFKFSLKMCVKILTLGISSLIMAVYYCVIGVCYNYFFAKYGSATTIAAFSVVGYVSYFYYLFAEGMTAGVQPIISYNYGAKRHYNIRRTLKKTAGFLFWIYVIFLAAVYLFQRPIAAAFCADDEALLQETVTGLRLYLLTCFLEGFILLGIIYFQAVDKGRKSALLSVMNLFIQFPFLVIMAHLWGVTGIWLVYPVANIPLAAFVFYSLRRDIKKSYRRICRYRAGKYTQNPAQTIPAVL